MISEPTIDCIRTFCASVDERPDLLDRPELSFFKEWVRRFKEADAESSDDEEEAPPGELSGEEEADRLTKIAEVSNDETIAIQSYTRAIELHPTARRFVSRGFLHYENNRFVEALDDARSALRINPDSARGYRLRALSAWNTDQKSCAYHDMCQAQRIDYDESYDALHNEMKTFANETQNEECFETQTDTSMPKLPDNVDFASLMNSPMFMNMANNVMNNPQLMSQMMSALHNNKP